VPAGELRPDEPVAVKEIVVNDTSSLIRALEAEYDLETGFLGRLRRGVFDQAGLERLIAVLDSIEWGDDRTVDRRLVALLWLIPTLMGWQVERVTAQTGDSEQLRHGIDKVQAILNGVLGTP
jgi:hypothetical protein